MVEIFHCHVSFQGCTTWYMKFLVHPSSFNIIGLSTPPLVGVRGPGPLTFSTRQTEARDMVAMHEVPPGDTVQDGILARDLVGDSARDVPDPGSAGRSIFYRICGFCYANFSINKPEWLGSMGYFTIFHLLINGGNIGVT